MFSMENMMTSNIIQAEQFIFRELETWKKLMRAKSKDLKVKRAVYM